MKEVQSFVRQLMASDQMARQPCSHMDQIGEVTPSSEGCQKCLEMGSTWVHLRICLICGHVGCCDASPNRHATAHYRETGHPVILSYEPGEGWLWCYADAEFMQPELDG
jgi:uncharacterized UBP type Zn finger protein